MSEEKQQVLVLQVRRQVVFVLLHLVTLSCCVSQFVPK